MHRLRVVHTIVVLEGLHIESICHVTFTASSSTCDEDVAVVCDAITANKTVDEIFVKLSAGSVVNVCNICRRLVKLSILDKPLQSVIFPVGIFNIHEKS